MTEALKKFRIPKAFQKDEPGQLVPPGKWPAKIRRCEIAARVPECPFVEFELDVDGKKMALKYVYRIDPAQVKVGAVGPDGTALTAEQQQEKRQGIAEANEKDFFGLAVVALELGPDAGFDPKDLVGRELVVGVEHELIVKTGDVKVQPARSAYWPAGTDPNDIPWEPTDAHAKADRRFGGLQQPQEHPGGYQGGYQGGPGQTGQFTRNDFGQPVPMGGGRRR